MMRNSKCRCYAVGTVICALLAVGTAIPTPLFAQIDSGAERTPFDDTTPTDTGTVSADGTGFDSNSTLPTASAATEPNGTAEAATTDATASALPTIEEFPLIARPHPNDDGYALHQRELQQWNRRYRQGVGEAEAPQPPSVFIYRLPQQMTVIEAAARFSVPYAGLATANRIANNRLLEAQRWIVVPAARGVFIPTSAQNELEIVMRALRGSLDDATIVSVSLPWHGDAIDSTGIERRERFYFIPGGDFLPFERTAFFGRLFHSPVKSGRITSHFGERLDPITQRPGFHNGIDIAAPLGSPVIATRSGTVAEVGIGDAIYGNYVVVTHEGGFSTVYAHLQRVTVDTGYRLSLGSQLGTIGNTGHSTGPHLHFEIQINGVAVNPQNYLYLTTLYDSTDGESEATTIENAIKAQ